MEYHKLSNQHLDEPRLGRECLDGPAQHLCSFAQLAMGVLMFLVLLLTHPLRLSQIRFTFADGALQLLELGSGDIDLTSLGRRGRDIEKKHVREMIFHNVITK